MLCESLLTLTLAHATITSARPGSSADVPGADAVRALRAFCRVTATLTPTSDSDIEMEVWVPADRSNGKLQAVGNAAWGGVIPYPAMAAAVAAG